MGDLINDKNNQNDPNGKREGKANEASTTD